MWLLELAVQTSQKQKLRVFCMHLCLFHDLIVAKHCSTNCKMHANFNSFVYILSPFLSRWINLTAGIGHRKCTMYPMDFTGLCPPVPKLYDEYAVRHKKCIRTQKYDAAMTCLANARRNIYICKFGNYFKFLSKFRTFKKMCSQRKTFEKKKKR